MLFYTQMDSVFMHAAGQKDLIGSIEVLSILDFMIVCNYYQP